MWHKFSIKLIKYRILFIMSVALATGLMFNFAKDVRLSYSIVNLLPENHQISVDFNHFKKKYGENNILTIAIEDKDFHKVENLRDWSASIEQIRNIEGVEEVVSLIDLPIILKNPDENNFTIKKWFKESYSQKTSDSVLNILLNEPFYNHITSLEKQNRSLVFIRLHDYVLLSPDRKNIILNIKNIIEKFSKKNNSHVYYSGLPYIRTLDSLRVKNEVISFIFLTLLITSLIIFFFFRSILTTLISVIVVAIGVIFAFGTMSIFNYEISIVMALVPPIIIVIGVPNCVFLINKFHSEYNKIKNRDQAIYNTINTIGRITILTNLTTASGFFAFSLISSQTLQEFGTIAALNILFIFLISIIVIPIFYSFISPPKDRHTKHLNKKWINNFTSFLIFLVNQKRRLIYIVSIILFFISIYGLSLIKTTGNITDDLPKEDVLYRDLKFFENNYGGIMPLEILIDTRKNNGLLKSYNIRKIAQLENELEKHTDFVKLHSYIDVLKYSKQAYYNGDTAFYNIPNSQDLRVIMSYLSKTKNDFSINKMMSDSLKKEARISLLIPDISTTKMDSIFSILQATILEIFDTEKYKVVVTGISYVFANSTKFLINNLVLSLLLVTFLIAIFMAWMFRSHKMVLISLVPNLFPLILTASIMGYFSIPLKPSTILVFSIAFGISVDDTIHFLAKYKQELLANKNEIKTSVYASIKETGISMLYTSIVLFFGFLVLTISDYGGTIALGLLVSIALLIAMLSNLILLPALLLSLERHIKKKNN